MAYNKPIKTFSYARKLKGMRPGPKNMKMQGKPVKAILKPDGKTLEILSAPPALVPTIKGAQQLRVRGKNLSPVGGGSPSKPAPAPVKPTPPAPKPKPVAPAPEPEEETTQPPPPPPPKPKATSSPQATRILTDAEVRKAMMVPVPDKGPIPTPYIDWNNLPKSCLVSNVAYMDYPNATSSRGMLPELREMFARSRRYQKTAPVNVVVQGPPGTGKSEMVKKFAEETGLPYWQIIGQEGIRADELLGHYRLKSQAEGGGSVWEDGIFPKAVRAGGILHIDEPNIIEPGVLMRLDELLDSKRQLNMEDLNGEIIPAHPDLFIVFTMNPPTYEGVKDLPSPIKSRLTRRYVMDYPPEAIEQNILKYKLKLSDAEFKPSASRTASATGKFAKDITDFMKIILGLRKEKDLSYTPSMRETQAFVQALKEGDGFFKAFDASLGNWYLEDEHDKVEQALAAVRRR